MSTATAPARSSLDEGRALAADVYRTGAELRTRTAERIVGLEDVIEQVLITILTRSHALLEGVQDPATGERVFNFARGPIFANLVLADEINRAPPKTQAALMEAMEERQVTSLGVRRELEDPFIVLATQNPIEQEGTYQLPMAQFDRFMFKIHLGYPSWEDEERIARLTALGPEGPLAPVVSRAQFLEIANALRGADVPAALVRYAVELVQATRPHAPNAPNSVREYVEWGAGPRAAQALVNGARARAFLRGRSVPGVDDVRALVPSVLRHRMVMSYAAEADAVTPDRVAQDLLESVPCPGPVARRRQRSWLRRLFDAVWTVPEQRRSA